MRVDRRRSQSAEVRQRLRGRLLGNGELERAGAEAEGEQLLDVRAALADEIGAGDPAVDDAVLDVLGHVGRPDEHDVHGRVAAGERERALTRLFRPEAGVLEQRDSRLAKPTLGRDRDRQAVCAGRRLRRASISR